MARLKADTTIGGQHILQNMNKQKLNINKANNNIQLLSQENAELWYDNMVNEFEIAELWYEVMTMGVQ